jgi:hypothetical protein
MWFSSWSHIRQPFLSSERRRADGFRRHRLAFHPRSELLEGRALLSTLTVTSNLGFGPGTLRAEIGIAQSGDTIVFDQSLRGQTIGIYTNPPSPFNPYNELVIDKSLDIEGPGAANLAIAGGNATRVFRVTAGVQVTLSGLTIEYGSGEAGGWDPASDDGQGGEILNYGTLTVSGCLVSGDAVNYNAYYGGGIYNAGTLTVIGSTVTHNIARYAGGGIYNAGTLTVSGSTVTHNVAWDGGGILNAGTLTILNSTVIDNSAHDGADVFTNHHFTKQNSNIGKIAKY